MFDSRREAEACRRGDIVLSHCPACGFIANQAYQPALTEYSARYEETQGYSATYRRYQEELVRDLIERHGIRGKHVIEIGCGKGEFLALLCAQGGNSGLGFDPAYRPDRAPELGSAEVEFVAQDFTEYHAALEADVFCCRMTLEHIQDVRSFAALLAGAAARRPSSLVFLQVPDGERLLRQALFCDVLYEHCSYFTAGSIRNLLAEAGLEVTGLDLLYAGQHLTVVFHGACRGPLGLVFFQSAECFEDRAHPAPLC